MANKNPFNPADRQDIRREGTLEYQRKSDRKFSEARANLERQAHELEHRNAKELEEDARQK